MNEFITQLFAAHATADTKTYLGRASATTLEMLGFITTELCSDTPTGHPYLTKIPSLELFIKLNDTRFRKAAVHLIQVAHALEGKPVPQADEVNQALGAYIVGMAEHSNECSEWLTWYNSYLAIEQGQPSDADRLMEAFPDDDFMVDVFEAMADCGTLTTKFHDNASPDLLARLGKKLITTRL